MTAACKALQKPPSGDIEPRSRRFVRKSRSVTPEVSYMPPDLQRYIDSSGQVITSHNWKAKSQTEWKVVWWLVKDKWSDDKIAEYARRQHFSYFMSHAQRNPHDPEGDLRTKIDSVRAAWEDKGMRTSAEGGVFQVKTPKQLNPERVLADGLVKGQSKAQFVKDCRTKYECCRQTPYNILKRGIAAGLIKLDEEDRVAAA